MIETTANNSSADQQQEWEENTLQPALQKLPETQKEFSTVSLKPIARLYTPNDLRATNFAEEIGFPGEPPSWSTSVSDPQ